MQENNKFFEIFKRRDNLYSVCLDQSNYCYDWVNEEKTKSCCYGDGHCYEDAFRDYLESCFRNLHQRLNYDSENGMFCVYCKNEQDANKVVSELSLLYNDENKMIELIKSTKEKYNYVFDVKI